MSKYRFTDRTYTDFTYPDGCSEVYSEDWEGYVDGGSGVDADSTWTTIDLNDETSLAQWHISDGTQYGVFYWTDNKISFSAGVTAFHYCYRNVETYQDAIVSTVIHVNSEGSFSLSEGGLACRYIPGTGSIVLLYEASFPRISLWEWDNTTSAVTTTLLASQSCSSIPVFSNAEDWVLEFDMSGGASIVGRLYEPDGTTLDAEVSATTTYTSAGYAGMLFDDLNQGGQYFFDNFTVCD